MRDIAGYVPSSALPIGSGLQRSLLCDILLKVYCLDALWKRPAEGNKARGVTSRLVKGPYAAVAGLFATVW